VVDVFMRLNR